MDAVLFEDAGGETDIGRQKGEVLRLGLADADVHLRLRRNAARQDQKRRDGGRACSAGYESMLRHGDLFPLLPHFPPLLAGSRASIGASLAASADAGKAGFR